MNYRILSEGAEAKIYIGKIWGEMIVVKERVQKKYREKALDEKLRSIRTKNEARIMYRATNAGVDVPTLLGVGKFSIYMSYVKGRLFRDMQKKGEVLEKLGELLARLHNVDIVHGDFTPANVIVDNGRPYVIDFGLASISKSLEEKAIDLLLMKRSLNQKQYKIFENSYIPNSKDGKKVLERLKEIEKRGRYQNRTLEVKS